MLLYSDITKVQCLTIHKHIHLGELCCVALSFCCVVLLCLSVVLCCFVFLLLVFLLCCVALSFFLSKHLMDN